MFFGNMKSRYQGTNNVEQEKLCHSQQNNKTTTKKKRKMKKKHNSIQQ